MTYQEQVQRLLAILKDDQLPAVDKANYLSTFKHTKAKWKKSWKALGVSSDDERLIKQYETYTQLSTRRLR